MKWPQLLLPLLCLLISPGPIQSISHLSDSLSNEQGWEEWFLEWQQQPAFMEEEAVKIQSLESFKEWLESLMENPLPINSATREELEALPFISPEQVENVCYYLYRYGPMLDLTELLLVEGFDNTDLKHISPFLRISTPENKSASIPTPYSIFHAGTHQIRLLTGSAFPFTSQPDSSERYLGNPIHSTLQYEYIFQKKFQYGFVIEKEAGEPWLDAHHKPDYFSFYLKISKTGRIKNLILGDFTFSTGQGLVSGNGFFNGTNPLNNPISSKQIIKRHFSTSASLFNRGLACSYRIYQSDSPSIKSLQPFLVEWTGFISSRSVDARKDSGKVSRLLFTSYHRTSEELETKDQLLLNAAGSYLQVKNAYASWGLTCLTWQMNADWSKAIEPYQLTQIRNKTSWNLSIDWETVFRKANWSGELALAKNKARAFVMTVQLTPYPRLKAGFLLRCYDPFYNALFGRGPGQKSRTGNEKGLSGSINWKILPLFQLSAYYDVYIFPWMQYRCDEPSAGSTWGIQSTWQLSGQTSLQLKISRQENEQNESESDKPNPSKETEHYWAGTGSYTVKSGPLSSRLGIQFKQWTSESNPSRPVGFSLSHQLSYRLQHPALVLKLSYALYDASEYACRMYSYEPSLPGTFSMPLLYGQGLRVNVQLNWKITRTGATCFN
jgi:hypothetical protein